MTGGEDKPDRKCKEGGERPSWTAPKEAVLSEQLCGLLLVGQVR